MIKFSDLGIEDQEHVSPRAVSLAVSSCIGPVPDPDSADIDLGGAKQLTGAQADHQAKAKKEESRWFVLAYCFTPL
jgi:hypothetical protein